VLPLQLPALLLLRELPYPVLSFRHLFFLSFFPQ
jgi:hypothetical protein